MARFGSVVAFLGVLLAGMSSHPLITFQLAHFELTFINASTFYLAETETQFSVNIANDSSHVFFYATSPAYSWVGFGFGDGMENAFMVVLYPSGDGNNVTISPRFATGHSEPSFASDFDIEALPGTGIVDDMFVVKAVCRNCRVWPGGFLDAATTSHPMMYAFGPGTNLQSSSLSAPLKRHVRYGKFTMDMEAATGKGGIPDAQKENVGVVMVGGIRKDSDRANLAHAVFGSLALFVLWPLNVLFAGFWRRIGIHVGLSGGVMVFLLVSFVLGGVTSGEYNRSKAYNSPHQILAFISLLPILLLGILPIRRIAALHTKIPRLHAPLATLAFSLLVLSGGLGLHLSSSSRPIVIAYAAIALLAFAFITPLQMCIRRRGSAYARATTRRRLGEEDDERELVAARNQHRKQNQSSSIQIDYPYPLAPAYSNPSGYTNPVPGYASPEQAAGHHTRSASAGVNGKNGLYGGGTMPGPKYLMNMHPGVPVHRW
ncbi:iron reductase domain protein [Pleomassaria siparia CBS 279.74]|uniref:Iron reductase domain protein n=1 Tax=Pleomassaria siparia CBS 279.74 TaxID=1314801 RepID=A0A6G1KP05_9PLEO|nr:iron reductase domain protein [Pleomassaria siparia CBS 279.74]